MSFNKENKVSWEELAPSTQELFKQLQADIITERTQRIISDNSLDYEIASLEEELNAYLDQKYNELENRAGIIETRVGNIFDDQNRLVFPNGDKFWIGWFYG